MTWKDEPDSRDMKFLNILFYVGEKNFETDPKWRRVVCDPSAT